MKYIEKLRNGLDRLLEYDKEVFIIGEDIGEPYGGAFKVTKGLSKKYPDRIIQTPMSEQGFTGMAIGMALNGLKPIVEIMFGDFITLSVDQIINHLTKFVQLYDEKLSFVIRTPSGGYRGYGATHSQSLERLFFGIPGMMVVAPSVLHSPDELIINAINCKTPVLFIENKLDYSREMYPINQMIEDMIEIEKVDETDFPIYRTSIVDENPEITFITYGGMVKKALEIQEQVYLDEEIAIEVIALSNVSDINPEQLSQNLRTNLVYTLEESWVKFGWGSYVISELIQKKSFQRIKALGSKNYYIPAAKSLEEFILPTNKTIIEEVLRDYNGKR